VNPVQITKSYYLAADDRNFILQRMHIVDPTKAPGYKPDPSSPAPQIREELRDAGYYPLNHTGLVAAVEIAVLREVNGSTTASSLAALLSEYTAEMVRLRTVIVDALRPKFDELLREGGVN